MRNRPSFRCRRSAPLSGAVGLSVFAWLAIACAPQSPQAVAQSIEAQAGRTAWEEHAGFAADFVVEFGGQRVLAGEMLTETRGSRARLSLDDGGVIVYDGKEVYVRDGSRPVQQARFHALTWTYFLKLQYKLRDPGARLEDAGALAAGPQLAKRIAPALDRSADETDNAQLPALRLSFEEGVGDTPDDWYLVYYDPQSYRVLAAAYIVTYGQSQAQAEEEPHAIVYEDYRHLDGAFLPMRWPFYHWNREEGVHGTPIGLATLKNPRFVEAKDLDDAFVRPEGARADKLPPINH